MKIQRMVVVMITTIVITSTLLITVSADPLHPGQDTRWYNGYYFCSSSGMQYGLDVVVDYTNMHTNWINRLTAALNSWDTAAGNYFRYSISDTGTTVEYYGISEIPSWLEGAYAVTRLRDTYGVWAFEFETGEINDFYRWFNYARIYVNKSYDNSLDPANMQKVLAHEMGHVLQLGHPTSKAESSIMHQGMIYGVVSGTPTTKDVNDLIDTYN